MSPAQPAWLARKPGAVSPTQVARLRLDAPGAPAAQPRRMTRVDILSGIMRLVHLAFCLDSTEVVAVPVACANDCQHHETAH